jgi:TrmH family RNA methyltransferase
MGSIARVNIIYTDLQELISKAQVPVYGTLLDGQDIYTQELSKEGIIVMGNEGNGISAPIRKLINRKLLIPQFHEGPESLNVAIATAITCSEFRRRYPL